MAAITFALWLTGAGCLFCCERVGAGSAHAAAADSHAKQAGAHATTVAPSVSSKHSCCTARVRPRGAEGRPARIQDGAAPALFTQARGGSRAEHGCYRESLQTLDAARKPRVATAPDSVAAAHAPAVAQRDCLRLAPQPRRRTPDRGGTHLLNCVLLI